MPDAKKDRRCRRNPRESSESRRALGSRGGRQMAIQTGVDEQQRAGRQAKEPAGGIRANSAYEREKREAPSQQKRAGGDFPGALVMRQTPERQHDGPDCS